MDTSGWSHNALAAVATSADLTLPLIALIAALVICALASAAETSLTSVNRLRIRNQAEEGDENARLIESLRSRPGVYLTTILVINNVAVIVASSLATAIALTFAPQWGGVIATVTISLVVLVFCEVTPKTAAVRNAEAWSRGLVRVVSAAVWLLAPVVALLNAITNALLRLVRAAPSGGMPSVTEEELMLMVSVGEEEGVIEEEERSMIHSIMELDQTNVREIMVPRIDMVTLEADTSLNAAIDLITQGGQSRIPVYDNTIDNIIGVLYAKDLLRELSHPRATDLTVRSIVRPALFVPESKKLDDLLHEMRSQRVHMAIVIDEYGAVAGLVTIEDLVEEIIGDIQDEYDREETLFERISPREFIVDAKMNLDDFNELAGVELEAGEEYDTIGGFVLSQLDKIPSVGDVVPTKTVTLTVLATRGRRVTSIKAVLPASDADAAPNEPPATVAQASDAAAPAHEPRRAKNAHSA